MNKISVIVPTYNVENHISRTLYSLINQSSSDFELVIVNDGSTDKTLEVINGIMASCAFRNYKIVSKKNGGVSSARNVGIAESTGQYLYFLDGDDYVSENFIKVINDELDSGTEDVVAWAYDTVNEDKSLITSFFDIYKNKEIELTGLQALKKCLEKQLWIWIGSAIFSKDLLFSHKIEYTFGCTNGEDQEFIFKALSRSKKVRFIDQTLSFYVVRNNSVSNSFTVKRFDTISALKRTEIFIMSTQLKENIEIDEKLISRYTIDNFLAIFRSLIEKDIEQSKYSKLQAVKKCIDKTERMYPGIFNMIKENIFALKTENFKNYKSIIKGITYMIFIISPTIYIYAMQLRNIRRTIKKDQL